KVGAVQSWLRRQGFAVEYTPANKHYVSAEGTIAQAQKAFGVPFGMYRVQGLTVRSPSSNVSIPSSLEGVVSGVLGLDDSAQFTQVVAPGTYHHPEKGRFQDPQGWYGEETLDLEAVHGMAPAANIVYVGAPNNFQDLDAALNHVVDRHLAQIVTNSYGFRTELLPPGHVKPYNDTLIQAAAEGIGVYFSSGDGGDELVNNGYATVDWPASSPWVTAVGG